MINLMSFLASSIFGHEFINYRKNITASNRQVFSNNVRHNLPGMIPVVIDSVDENLSLALNGCDTSMPKRMWKYGKEYSMSINTTVDEVLTEINKDIQIIGKKFVLGLEDGTLLKGNENLSKIYSKNKNDKDQILYFLLTQESTIYGYILSILRYLGILPHIKSKDKLIIKKKFIKDDSAKICIDYLYEINHLDNLDDLDNLNRTMHNEPAVETERHQQKVNERHHQKVEYNETKVKYNQNNETKVDYDYNSDYDYDYDSN
jgi:hypothetical protein